MLACAGSVSGAVVRACSKTTPRGRGGRAPASRRSWPPRRGGRRVVSSVMTTRFRSPGDSPPPGAELADGRHRDRARAPELPAHHHHPASASTPARPTTASHRPRVRTTGRRARRRRIRRRGSVGASRHRPSLCGVARGDADLMHPPAALWSRGGLESAILTDSPGVRQRRGPAAAAVAASGAAGRVPPSTSRPPEFRIVTSGVLILLVRRPRPWD
jgi:hypothetical protein